MANGRGPSDGEPNAGRRPHTAALGPRKSPRPGLASRPPHPATKAAGAAQLAPAGGARPPHVATQAPSPRRHEPRDPVAPLEAPRREPSAVQRAFSQAPRFLPTFTTATGLVGIDTERARELRELEAPKPKPKPVNVTKRLQGFKWRGSSNAISADVDAWLRGTPAFPASGATMNCFEAVIVDVVAVSKLVSKADVLEAIDAARNKPLRALSGLLTVLGWDSAAPVGSDDELRKGDVLFFAEGPTEIAHVVRYVRKNEEGHHLVRSHWTKPDGQGYRVVRLDKLREYHEIQDAQMSVSSTRRSV